MSSCQICGLLGPYGGEKVKLRTADIREAAGNGCGGCTLLLDTIGQFVSGSGEDDRISKSTEIWCTPSYLPRVQEGSRSHLSINFEEQASASSFGIELFTSSESIIDRESRPLLLPGFDVFGTRSSSSKAQLRGWIDKCSRHDKCAKYSSTTSKLPTRVIDVGPGPLNGPINLHISGGEYAPYVCLSHCWGSTQPFKTMASNIEQHRSVIAFDALPKTFQDAVNITRSLKVRYLWIDAVCIIQDSQDDWREEASKMADIYRGGYLTITAAWSPSSLGGIYNDDTASKYSTKSIKCSNPQGGLSRTVYARQAIRHGFRSDPIYSRGWCFQEWLLSPRIVHFNSQEMVWECSEETYCECGQTWWSPITHIKQKATAVAESKNHDLKERAQWWHALIQQYSNLNLTFGKDKLPAFSGVARWIRGGIPARYCAGLWQDTLLNDLVWQRDSKKIPEQRPTRWRAPTWSWAATRSPVMWPSSSHFETYPGLTVVDVSIRSNGNDEFGEVAAAELKIQGLLHKLYVSIGDEKVTARVAGRDLEVIMDFDWQSEHNPRAIDKNLWYLPVGRHPPPPYSNSVECKDIALVLLRKADAENTFERLGLMIRVVSAQDAIEWTTEAELPKDCLIRIV